MPYLGAVGVEGAVTGRVHGDGAVVNGGVYGRVRPATGAHGQTHPPPQSAATRLVLHTQPVEIGRCQLRDLVWHWEHCSASPLPFKRKVRLL